MAKRVATRKVALSTTVDEAVRDEIAAIAARSGYAVALIVRECIEAGLPAVARRHPAEPEGGAA